MTSSQSRDFRLATLNILEDFTGEKLRLEETQRALLNLLEDFDLEKTKVQKARDVLEDRVAERTTELTQANARLQAALADVRRSNEELEQFAYVASHDLQEPLRMVSSYTQLLARHFGDELDDDAGKYMSYAVDGAKRMQQLIEGLLAYSRVGTRGKPLEVTDSHSMLEEALRNLAASVEESGAVVTSDDLPAVRADSTQLVQVFQNLVGNAVKFRKPDVPPRIHVSAGHEPAAEAAAEWIFSVHDNGIGIDPRYADRIFAIFQRLHARDEYPGAGIGLALCKHIVERHGGRIWFESKPGEGSTFCFTLPD